MRLVLVSPQGNSSEEYQSPKSNPRMNPLSNSPCIISHHLSTFLLTSGFLSPWFRSSKSRNSLQVTAVCNKRCIVTMNFGRCSTVYNNTSRIICFRRCFLLPSEAPGQYGNTNIPLLSSTLVDLRTFTTIITAIPRRELLSAVSEFVIWTVAYAKYLFDM